MTRSLATVTVACVRPTWSTVEIRPWNMSHAADNGSIRGGEENPVADDLGAIEGPIAQRDQEWRSVDQVGRPRGDRELLLVDLEPNASLVFERRSQAARRQLKA